MKPALDLYFIALVIPGQVGEKINGIKALFEEKYGSKAALRSPPHITLHMPFKARPDKMERTMKELKVLSTGFAPLTVELEGFGAFEPRVIYIQVKENPNLVRLQKEVSDLFRRILNQDAANYRERPFQPHVTVAFRDLSKANFRLAWDSFKNQQFDETLIIKNVGCLKHNGKRWEIWQQFTLPGVNEN